MLLPQARFALSQLVRKAETQAALRPAAIMETTETLAQSAMKKLGVPTIHEARVQKGLGGLYTWLGRQGVGAEHELRFIENLATGKAAGIGEGTGIYGERVTKQALEQGILTLHPTDPSRAIVAKDPLSAVSETYKSLTESELTAITKYTPVSARQIQQYDIATKLGMQKYKAEESKLSVLKEQLQASRLGYSSDVPEEMEYVGQFSMYEQRRKQLIQDRAYAYQKYKETKQAEEAIKTQSLPKLTAQNPIDTNKNRTQHQIRSNRVKHGNLYQGEGGTIL